MQISIKPVEATLTRDTELIGKMDPFCKVYLGGQMNRTGICDEGGQDPHWNDTFYYTLQPNSDPTLRIEVWDDDTGDDDIVGSGTYNLSQYLMSRQSSTFWVDIFHQKGSAGKVCVNIGFNPNQVGMGGGIGFGGGMGIGGGMGGNIGGNAWGNNPNNNQFGGGNFGSGW